MIAASTIARTFKYQLRGENRIRELIGGFLA